MLVKDSDFIVGISSAFNEDPKTLSISKSLRQQPRRSAIISENNVEVPVFSQNLDLLWPKGKAISDAKLADIESLLHLIPGDAKQFYTNITADSNTVDDIDGFDGSMDFEVEED